MMSKLSATLGDVSPSTLPEDKFGSPETIVKPDLKKEMLSSPLSSIMSEKEDESPAHPVIKTKNIDSGVSNEPVDAFTEHLVG